jgi:hypothetical protein
MRRRVPTPAILTDPVLPTVLVALAFAFLMALALR